MTVFSPISGLAGGLLIGTAALLLMLVFGRIAGVSGIAASLLTGRDAAGRSWRAGFLTGLPAGALLTDTMGFTDLSAISMPASATVTVIAGLLVGIGTVTGGGCTSGHGICGLARFSGRSLAATATFMAAAAATVFVTRHLL